MNRRRRATVRHWFAVVTGGVLASFCACTTNPPTLPAPASDPASPPDRPLFRDVTPGSGVDFTYRNGEEMGYYAILETLGGGVALLDYDGDGLLDVFFTGGGTFDRTEEEYRKDPSHPPRIVGRPCKLYRNLGGWKFEDVTAKVGLDKPLFYTHGCAVADYDRDGWPDLLVTGWGRLALFHNEPDGKGGRRFVEVTRQAGLDDDLWSTSAAWGDLDGDGYPDLYVCHYVDWSLPGNNGPCNGFDGHTRDICPPANFNALPHRLYRNQGDGTFRDVSRVAGLRLEHPQKEYGKGLGVLMVDVDGDGKPDVYVANDMTDNFLYHNRSSPGAIRLEEVGLDSGTARDDHGAPNGSMGLAAADYDGSGRPSLWVTNYELEDHALYGNECRDGRLQFRYSTHVAGISRIGQSFVGWGTGFLDVDHHGWEDLFIANGHPNHYPRAKTTRQQRPVLLRNESNGRFRDISGQGGPYFQAVHGGRGVALGDLDNDGRTDLVVSHLNEPVVLLRNEAEAGHWLGVELVGDGHRDIVGARLTLEVDGRRLTRFAQGGGSYASASDPRHVFGLGTAERVGRLTVTWPSGRTQHWDGLAIDRYWRLVEGRDTPEEPRR
jgi:hypothetical protein